MFNGNRKKKINLDSENEYTPPEIINAAKITLSNLVPNKSRNKYEMIYNITFSWIGEKRNL